MTGPKPQGPTHPTPTGPPRTDIYAVAEVCGFGDLQTPARPFSTVGRGSQGGPVYSGRDGKGAVERASRPVELPSGGGRAGVSQRPGAVSESSRAGAGEPLPVLAVAAGGRSGGVDVVPGPGFALPDPPGPPRFDGDGPVRPGQPGPPPRPQPTGPVPHPPPPVSA